MRWRNQGISNTLALSFRHREVEADMDRTIAERLATLRKDAGMSQEDLAIKLGVTRQAISRWERGKVYPDTENIIMLARLYGLSIDALLGLSGGPA